MSFQHWFNWSFHGLQTSIACCQSRGQGLNRFTIHSSFFSTLTKWKLLCFTNFYYFAVSQNLPVSLLTGGVLEEGWAQICQDDIWNSWIFHFMKITAKYKTFENIRNAPLGNILQFQLQQFQRFKKKNYFAKPFPKIDLYVNLSMAMSLERLQDIRLWSEINIWLAFINCFVCIFLDMFCLNESFGIGTE